VSSAIKDVDPHAEVDAAQKVGGRAGQQESFTVRASALTAQQAEQAKTALVKDLGVDAKQVSDDQVSAAWGGQVTRQAVIGLVIFLVLVMAYLVVRFEWRMAAAAVSSLLLDLILTAGVYSLVGFEVTPSTVIGFLTILGFALYDVVVVFDKIQENTRGITGSSTQTYGEAANLAVNQTLMRSINTAVVALLPVGGLLFIGAGLLGAGTLKDLGLVLFVGMLVAVYSSIFFATPVLVDLKEQEPRFKLHKQRVLQRRAGLARDSARKATAKAVSDEDDDSDDEDTPALAGAGAARAAANQPTGARQPARKRTGAGGKPGGSKPRGARSGGRKR
jgi:preprotein translocase subunit SecF